MLECDYCGEEESSARGRKALGSNHENVLCSDCDAFLNYGDHSRRR